MANWYMAKADEFGNAIEAPICVTDSVLDTCGESFANADSSEQAQALDALIENEFGVINGTLGGVGWFA